MQGASEVVYVAEVLLCCSSDIVKQAPDLPPCPTGNEKGRNGGKHDNIITPVLLACSVCHTLYRLFLFYLNTLQG